MIALLGSLAAAAIPELSADDWRNSWVPTETVAVFGARRLEGGAAGAELVWSQRPLVQGGGPEGSQAVIRELFTAHLGGAWGMGPFVASLDVPVHLLRTSDLDPLRVAVPGDPAIDLAWVPLSGKVGGLAARGRVTVPLGAAALQLGQPGPTAEVGISGELRFGKLGLAADIGRRFAPSLTLYDLPWKDRWTAQAALIVPAGGPVWVSLEGRAALPGNLRVVAHNTTLEGLVAVHGRHKATIVHGGVAWAGSQGVGVPAWRLFVGVRWGPGATAPVSGDAPEAAP
jgi:hypothetical protein